MVLKTTEQYNHKNHIVRRMYMGNDGVREGTEYLEEIYDFQVKYGVIQTRRKYFSCFSMLFFLSINILGHQQLLLEQIGPTYYNNL